MKLYENKWQIFLKENLQSNIKFLEFYTDKKGDTISDKLGIKPNNFEALLSKIPGIDKFEIQEVLGSGQYGIAYHLDNDHVLKIFEPRLDDMDKYKEMWDRQFAGTGNKHDPAVYSLGLLDKKVAYVELGKVLTIDQWAQRNKVNIKNFDAVVDLMYQFFAQFHRKLKAMTLEGIEKHFMELIYANPHNIEVFSKVTPKITKPLLKALGKYIKKTGKVYDLHSGNFGVIETVSAKEPNIFVFFDI